MIWYGLVWCGMVLLQCGMTWCGMVRHSVTWYGLVWYSTCYVAGLSSVLVRCVWYGKGVGMVQYGVAYSMASCGGQGKVRYGEMQYVWYGMLWFVVVGDGAVRHGMV